MSNSNVRSVMNDWLASVIIPHAAVTVLRVPRFFTERVTTSVTDYHMLPLDEHWQTYNSSCTVHSDCTGRQVCEVGLCVCGAMEAMRAPLCEAPSVHVRLVLSFLLCCALLPATVVARVLLFLCSLRAAR